MKTRNLLVFRPLLLQDYILHEKMAHFNGNAFGKGGTRKRFRRFGTFTVTHDISKYTKAKMFSEIGKETKVSWVLNRGRRKRIETERR
jgi:catalase